MSDAYVNGLRNLGLRIHNMSKWNNTVVVETADTTLMQRVRQLAYVKGVRCVWESPDSLPVAKVVARESEVTNKRDTTLADYYGYAAAQVKMLGVDQMHQQGYNGNGVTIGVIDGGFIMPTSWQALTKPTYLARAILCSPPRACMKSRAMA